MIEDINQRSKELFEDGFTHIKSLLNGDEIALLINAIEANMNNPSPFGKNMISENGGKFFMDFNNWSRLKPVKDFCFLPKLTDLVVALTKSKKCWLFHDHVLVKFKHGLPTPTHQDRPYYIFKGDLNLSVWITPDYVPKNSSLIFYKKTHKMNKIFMPKSFVDGENMGINSDFEVINDETFEDYEKIVFDMNPGDALVFFNNTIHGSNSHISDTPRRALSVRFLLDGATMTKKYFNATPPFDKFGIKIEEDAPVPENFFPLLRG
jgi:ectoine hydroxylase-related dioxygenase (phytanoyl-CoA dioxygenase family)